MLDIKFEYDPRMFEAAYINAVTRSIGDKVAHLKCPNGHTDNPTIKFLGGSIEKFQLNLTCCCKDFEKVIRLALSGQAGTSLD